MVLDQVKGPEGTPVDSVSDSSKNNFQLSGAKSHTNCKIASNKITCARPASDADAATWMDSGVTYHWFRNFSTEDEAGYDIQLTEADGDKKRNMFSFVWMWFDETKAESSAPNKEYLNAVGGDDYGCAPITASAYKTLVTDVEAAEKKKAEEEAAKKAEEEKNKNNTKDEDWATQTTAHATALLAAVYALAF